METTSESTTSPEPTDEMTIQAEMATGEPVVVVSPSPKKKTWVGIAILAAVLLLAGAAFLGARLLSQPQAANNSNGDSGGMMKKMGGGPGSEEVTIERQPAEELPDREPDILGEVSELKDNSLMVTPVGNITVSVNQDGETNKDVQYVGAETEVVVTQETKIYLDVTNDSMPIEKPAESMVIEQKLEAADLSQVGEGGIVMVWGYKRGDRLIAETIVLEILPQ